MLPKLASVAKGFLHQVKEKGVATALFGFLLGKVSRQSAADIKEDFTKEAMAKQCLAFYLEQYKTLMLQDVEFPKEFRVDHIIGTLSAIYFQHLTPMVKYRNGSTAEITIKPIQAVSHYVLCYNMCVHTTNVHVRIIAIFP